MIRRLFLVMVALAFSASSADKLISLAKADTFAEDVRQMFARSEAAVVFDSDRDEPGNMDLYVMDLDGTNVQRITYGSEWDVYPSISRDGKKLVWLSSDQPKIMDTATGVVVNLDLLGFVPGASNTPVMVSPNSRTVVYSDGGTRLKDLETGQVVIAENETSQGMGWIPGSNSIVVAGHMIDFNASAEFLRDMYRLWISDSWTGKRIRQLTYGSLMDGSDEAPAVSFGGDKVAYIRQEPPLGSGVNYNPTVRLIGFDGKDDRKLMDWSFGNPYRIDWTPDGRNLIVAANVTNRVGQLFLVDVNAKKVIRALTTGDGGSPAVFQPRFSVPLKEDVNHDGMVDISDLILVARDFGGSQYDLDKSGETDILDLIMVARKFGESAAEGVMASPSLMLNETREKLVQILSKEDRTKITTTAAIKIINDLVPEVRASGKKAVTWANLRK